MNANISEEARKLLVLLEAGIRRFVCKPCDVVLSDHEKAFEYHVICYHADLRKEVRKLGTIPPSSYFSPLEIHRVYEEGTNAKQPSLPYIEQLPVLLGKVCQECTKCYPYNQYMYQHARKVHGWKFPQGNSSFSLKSMGLLSRGLVLIQSLYKDNPNYFVINEQDRTDLLSKCNKDEMKGNFMLTNLHKLQKRLDACNIFGSDASGQFICRPCGEAISFNDPNLFQKHFKEMHGLTDIQGKEMMKIASEMKLCFAKNHFRRHYYVNGTSAKMTYLPAIPGLTVRKGMVCPVPNCGLTFLTTSTFKPTRKGNKTSSPLISLPKNISGPVEEVLSQHPISFECQRFTLETLKSYRSMMLINCVNLSPLNRKSL